VYDSPDFNPPVWYQPGGAQPAIRLDGPRVPQSQEHALKWMAGTYSTAPERLMSEAERDRMLEISAMEVSRDEKSLEDHEKRVDELLSQETAPEPRIVTRADTEGMSTGPKRARSPVILMSLGWIFLWSVAVALVAVLLVALHG
jgi:hypothetical protein